MDYRRIEKRVCITPRKGDKTQFKVELLCSFIKNINKQTLYTNRLGCPINYVHRMRDEGCSPHLSLKGFMKGQATQCDTWFVGIRHFPLRCIRRKRFFFKVAARKGVVTDYHVSALKMKNIGNNFNVFSFTLSLETE